jgi:hypothetical protein
MATATYWAKKCNDECEHNKEYKKGYLWNEDMFDVDLNDRIEGHYCNETDHELCATCEDNIAKFNDSNTTKDFLLDKICSIENFLSKKFSIEQIFHIAKLAGYQSHFFLYLIYVLYILNVYQIYIERMDFRKHFSDQLVKSLQGDTKAVLEIRCDDKIKTDSKITIMPLCIDCMKNIEVTPSKYICKIYGNDKLLSETKYVPDILLTMYIEKKIVLEFEELLPNTIIIKYDAIVLGAVEKFCNESKIQYNTGPVHVSDLKVTENATLLTNGERHDTVNSFSYYRACSDLSRMAKYGIGDSIKKHIEYIDKCEFCDIDIKPNYRPIWYVNMPKNDFFLCYDCGETIGEKTDDVDIFQCHKFKKWHG